MKKPTISQLELLDRIEKTQCEITWEEYDQACALMQLDLLSGNAKEATEKGLIALAEFRAKREKQRKARNTSARAFNNTMTSTGMRRSKYGGGWE